MEPHYGSHNFRAITQATCLYVDANAAANENVFFFPRGVTCQYEFSHNPDGEKENREKTKTRKILRGSV